MQARVVKAQAFFLPVVIRGNINVAGFFTCIFLRAFTRCTNQNQQRTAKAKQLILQSLIFLFFSPKLPH
jgi:hypothetical protein